MAIPSFYLFNQLPLREQLGIVLGEGAYLPMRFGEEEDRINLYHIGSFFAEVFYDSEVNYLHHCRAFVSTEPLDAYTDRFNCPKHKEAQASSGLSRFLENKECSPRTTLACWHLALASC